MLDLAVLLATCAPCAQPDPARLPHVDRTWIGPEFFANRLQDWRRHNGRIECVEARAAKPMRVLHLLTAWSSSRKGRMQCTVRTGAIDTGARNDDSLAGFLIGSGGDHVDYRLTSLVHHRPAPDGGIVCGVDGRGRVTFRDFEHNTNSGGQWSLGGKLRDGELREIAPSSRDGAGFTNDEGCDVELTLHVEPRGETYRLELVARRPDGRLLSQATLDDVSPALCDGGLALCSHRGPKESRRGHWFADWRISGDKVDRDPARAFGPILCTQYTVSGGILRLTAQVAALGPQDTRTAELQVRDGPTSTWRTTGSATLVENTNTFCFQVTPWDATTDRDFRVRYELARDGGRSQTCDWHGTIRREPEADEPLVVAAFTGNKHFTGGIRWNHDGVWFPHRDIVDHVTAHGPDLLFFSGDQIYEGDLTGAQRKPLAGAMLDYHDKWYRWCWAFGDLARDRPCICIPDDHDVYHGNIWGAGGRAAKRQDDGGYRMPAEFVRMVETTQTSHLPAPVDPRPVEQGIGVYFTSLEYGGVDFAILEDRKFKSSPTVQCPEGKVVNGWFRAEGYDPAAQADTPGAVLLGDRQLAFLDRWASDWGPRTWMKCVLSQTIFANVATIPASAASGAVLPSLPHLPVGAYPEDQKLAADADSNGWPQTGRNAALQRMRKAFAFHIAGDQHLGSLVHYGLDDWNDAGWAFCVPSIANTWPRRWFPPEPGRNRAPDSPRYTGEFRDGFGNRITVHAVSNPHAYGRAPAPLHDRAPGYGIVRFAPKTRTIRVECWPRWADPRDPDAAQYPGWPKEIAQLDNYGKAATTTLPELRVDGMRNPVVQVIDASGELVYTRRVRGRSVRLGVFAAGRYTVQVGEPREGKTRTIQLDTSSEGPVTVSF